MGRFPVIQNLIGVIFLASFVLHLVLHVDPVGEFKCQNNI